MSLLLILCGCLIGFILISLGMGAALYIGCLITFFHLSDKTAAASALVITLPALVIGTYFYRKQNVIDYQRGKKLLFWAILGTIGGSIVVPYINKKYYQIIISLILIVLACTILSHVLIDPHVNHKKKLDAKIHGVMAKFASVVSGVMIGLAGMSGGGPLVAGMLLLNTPVATAAATSSFIRIWTTILGITLHFSTMTIAWKPVLWMSLGTIIGAILAPKIMKKIEGKQNRFNQIMKPLIAIILLYMGLKPLVLKFI